MQLGRRTRRFLLAWSAALLLLAPATAQASHGLLDHPAPGFGPSAPPSPSFSSGGPGAQWQLVATIPTGNPHTDVDFFTRGGETYLSAGTLAIGPNGGGQTIVQLTENGEVAPAFLAAHPSASCLSNPSAATGLQHDVEATPKGAAILNTLNPSAVRQPAELLIDATDAAGRCHDQGMLGLSSAPQGGLEIVDVTDPANPVEIGLVSHIGEAHTVNVDPKRPHIAIVSTSDSVTVNASGERANEDPANDERFDLDGFEIVDLSSCMGFAPGVSVDDKRDACRPSVYRYRYPTTDIALGHTLKSGANAIYACHESEIYPDDTLACGSGNALITFDMSGAFLGNGTPDDFSDDTVAGTPLPCTVRPSSSTVPFQTGAMVTDCVDGTGPGTDDLTVAPWLDSGAPSISGVVHRGSVFHQGRGAGGAATPAYDSTEDIDFNHEAEYSASGNTLLATDERGGGILPPGATCTPGTDNKVGNGGVHFYDPTKLAMETPATPEEAFEAYARTPQGDKAIFRVPIRTQPRGTVCTAHVFHQIPGQNRIFMAWYSQGTHIIDFVEHPNGTITFEEAGWMIPANANQWVSAVFKRDQNPDGSSTYWGATGDFNLGEAGRNAIDIFKVTLPPAPRALPPGSSAEQPPTPSNPADPGAVGGRCAQRQAGTNQSDRLFGSIAGDRIFGRGGGDRIRARKGADCVLGGTGADRIWGGPGRDLLRGGKGSERIRGGDGADVLRGGFGADVLICGRGRDIARGVQRMDRVRGCERVRPRPGPQR